MFRLRSCASSRMIVSYAESILSLAISASRMPSVISFTRVFGPVWSPNRMVYPTAAPNSVSVSSAICSGGDPAWLRVADGAPDPAADLQADLRQLGRLPGPGLARREPGGDRGGRDR